MRQTVTLALFALLVGATLTQAAGLSGQYIEARTCDVWTGPCFANAEENLEGKHAVIGWKVDKGELNSVSLDGLGIVAVIEASDTLGIPQTGASRAILIVDKRASAQQQKALIQMAKQQAGQLLSKVVKVQKAKISLVHCACKGNVCATLTAGSAKVETRCLHAKHDVVCGNESVYHKPLTPDVKATAAMVVENIFTGTGIGQTWTDRGRRGAYVGSFKIR